MPYDEQGNYYRSSPGVPMWDEDGGGVLTGVSSHLGHDLAGMYRTGDEYTDRRRAKQHEIIRMAALNGDISRDTALEMMDQPEDPRNIVEKIMGLKAHGTDHNILMPILDLLSPGMYASAAFSKSKMEAYERETRRARGAGEIGKDETLPWYNYTRWSPFAIAGSDFKQYYQNRTMYGDVFDVEYNLLGGDGFGGRGPDAAAWGVLAADIFADPLTYTGIGLVGKVLRISGISKHSAQKFARAGAKGAMAQPLRAAGKKVPFTRMAPDDLVERMMSAEGIDMKTTGWSERIHRRTLALAEREATEELAEEAARQTAGQSPWKSQLMREIIEERVPRMMIERYDEIATAVWKEDTNRIARLMRGNKEGAQRLLKEYVGDFAAKPLDLMKPPPITAMFQETAPFWRKELGVPFQALGVGSAWSKFARSEYSPNWNWVKISGMDATSKMAYNVIRDSSKQSVKEWERGIKKFFEPFNTGERTAITEILEMEGKGVAGRNIAPVNARRYDPKLVEAANYAKKVFKDIADEEQKYNILNNTLQGYVTHLFNGNVAKINNYREVLNKRSHSLTAEWAEKINPFSLHRRIASIDDMRMIWGDDAILTDIAEIMFRRKRMSLEMLAQRKWLLEIQTTRGYGARVLEAAKSGVPKGIKKMMVDRRSTAYEVSDLSQFWVREELNLRKWGFVTTVDKGLGTEAGKRSGQAWASDQNLKMLRWITSDQKTRPGVSEFVGGLKGGQTVTDTLSNFNGRINPKITFTRDKVSKTLDINDYLDAATSVVSRETNPAAIEVLAELGFRRWEDIPLSLHKKILTTFDRRLRKDIGPLSEILPELLHTFNPKSPRAKNWARRAPGSSPAALTKLLEELGKPSSVKMVPGLADHVMVRAKAFRRRMGDASDLVAPHPEITKMIKDHVAAFDLHPNQVQELLGTMFNKKTIQSLSAREADQLDVFLGIQRIGGTATGGVVKGTKLDNLLKRYKAYTGEQLVEVQMPVVTGTRPSIIETNLSSRLESLGVERGKAVEARKFAELHHSRNVVTRDAYVSKARELEDVFKEIRAADRARNKINGKKNPVMWNNADANLKRVIAKKEALIAKHGTGPEIQRKIAKLNKFMKNSEIAQDGSRAVTGFHALRERWLKAEDKALRYPGVEEFAKPARALKAQVNKRAAQLGLEAGDAPISKRGLVPEKVSKDPRFAGETLTGAFEKPVLRDAIDPVIHADPIAKVAFEELPPHQKKMMAATHAHLFNKEKAQAEWMEKVFRGVNEGVPGEVMREIRETLEHGIDLIALRDNTGTVYASDIFNPRAHPDSIDEVVEFMSSFTNWARPRRAPRTIQQAKAFHRFKGQYTELLDNLRSAEKAFKKKQLKILKESGLDTWNKKVDAWDWADDMGFWHHSVDAEGKMLIGHSPADAQGLGWLPKYQGRELPHYLRDVMMQGTVPLRADKVIEGMLKPGYGTSSGTAAVLEWIRPQLRGVDVVLSWAPNSNYGGRWIAKRMDVTVPTPITAHGPSGVAKELEVMGGTIEINMAYLGKQGQPSTRYFEEVFTHEAVHGATTRILRLGDIYEDIATQTTRPGAKFKKVEGQQVLDPDAVVAEGARTVDGVPLAGALRADVDRISETFSGLSGMKGELTESATRLMGHRESIVEFHGVAKRTINKRIVDEMERLRGWGDHGFLEQGVYDDVAMRSLGISEHDLYGLKNPLEFVAEAFSNPRFQSLLKSIPWEGKTGSAAGRGVAGKMRTMWDHVVNMVASVLGISRKDRDLLAHTMDVTRQMFDEPIENHVIALRMDTYGRRIRQQPSKPRHAPGVPSPPRQPPRQAPREAGEWQAVGEGRELAIAREPGTVGPQITAVGEQIDNFRYGSFWLPESHAALLDDINTSMYGHKLGKLMRGYDMTQAYFKSRVMAPFIEFHKRNAVTDIGLSMLKAGFALFHTGHFTDFTKVLTYGLKHDLVDVKHLTSSMASSGAVMGAEVGGAAGMYEGYHEGEGFLDTTAQMVGHGLKGALGGAALGTVAGAVGGKGVKSGLEGLEKYGKRIHERKALRYKQKPGAKLGEQTITLSNGAKFTIKEFYEEMAKRGVFNTQIQSEILEETGSMLFTMAKSAGKKVPAGALHAAKAKQTIFMQDTFRAGELATTIPIRTMLFTILAKESGNLGIAAQGVKKYLYDYSNLNMFERRVMRRMIPFYTWTKHALGANWDALMRRPGMYSAQLKPFVGMAKDDGVDPADHPDWLSNKLSRFSVSFNPVTGEREVEVKQGYGLVQEELIGVWKDAQGVISMLGDEPSKDASRVLSRGPFGLTSALEGLANFDTFRQGNITSDLATRSAYQSGKEWDNAPDWLQRALGYEKDAATGKSKVDPRASWMLREIPPSRVYSIAKRVMEMDEEGRRKVNWLSLAGGLLGEKVYVYGPEQRLYRDRARLDRVAQWLNNLGITQPHTSSAGVGPYKTQKKRRRGRRSKSEVYGL